MFFLARSTGSRATRTASENTPLTPSLLLAEHSMYPAALIDLASFLASLRLSAWRCCRWLDDGRIACQPAGLACLGRVCAAQGPTCP